MNGRQRLVGLIGEYRSKTPNVITDPDVGGGLDAGKPGPLIHIAKAGSH